MKNLRRLISLCNREERGLVLWMAVQVAATALLPLVAVFVPKWIIDELLGLRQIGRLIGLLALYGLARFLLRYMASQARLRLELRYEKLYRRLHAMLSEKAMRLRLEDSERKSTLDLLERSDFALQMIFWITSNVQQVASSLLSILSVLIILVGAAPWLTLLLTALALLAVPCAVKLKALNVENAQRDVPEVRAFRYFTEMSVDFRYAKDLRLYRGDELMLKRAKQSMDRILKVNHAYYSQVGLYEGLSGMTVEMQSVSAFLVLGLQLLSGAISPGSFSMLYAASRQYGKAMNELLDSWSQLWANCEHLDALFDYLDMEEATEQTPDDSAAVKKAVKDALNGRMHWQGRDICFKYPTGEGWVLDHLNFEILEGETLALVGRNGAGKSTLVKLLCRLWEPEQGQILLNGVDIRDIPKADYDRILSPTFQDYQLLPVRIDENIACLNHEDIDDDEAAQLREAAERIGVSDWIEALPDKAASYLSRDLSDQGILPSGGQGQKIALARSVAHGGGLILMDEPTAALDPKAEEEVFATMLQVTRGQTAVFISHRLSSTRYADRILVMEGGRIVQEGRHEALLNQEGLYREMYRLQARQYVEQD